MPVPASAPATTPQLQLQPAPTRNPAPAPFAEPPARLNLRGVNPNQPAPVRQPLNLPRPLNLGPTPNAANNAVPLNLPQTPTNNGLTGRSATLPSAAKPLTLAPAAAPAASTAPGIGAVAGVAGVGFVGGAAIGELARRELVDQGFDDLQYPSNTGELLRDPIGTTIDGVNQTARDLADFFSPEQDPRVNESAGPEFLEQVALGDPPFQGGQTPGVLYIVQTRYSEINRFGQITEVVPNFQFHLEGPIRGSEMILPKTVRGQDGFDQLVIHYGDGLSRVAHNVSSNSALFDGSISVVGRVDGEPDTGGDPPPQLVTAPLPRASSTPAIQSTEFAPRPLNLPQTAPTTSPTAPASTPSPIPPSVPLTLPLPVPTGLPSVPSSLPTLLPSPQPQATPQGQPSPSSQPQGSPVSTTSPNPTPRATVQTLPQPQPQPQPQPRQLAAPPGLGCDPCLSLMAPPQNRRPDLDEPDPSGEGEIELEPCDPNDEPFTDDWQGEGFEGVFEAFNFFERVLAFIYEQLKEKESGGIAVPEWWAVRPGADIPQLAVALKEIDADGNLLSSRWSFSIPHYIGEREVAPNIPPFQKGSKFGTLTLTDNTKLVINAVSEEEAEGVINAIIPYIDPAFLGGRDIKFGTRKGAALTEARVKPVRADFYPDGQRDADSEWFVHFS